MYALKSLSLFVTYVSSISIPPGQSLGSQISTSLVLPNGSAFANDGLTLQSPSNLSVASLNASAGKELRTQCSEQYGGSPLNYDSCMQVLGTIAGTSIVEIWTMRHILPISHNGIPLPYRWLSGT